MLYTTVQQGIGSLKLPAWRQAHGKPFFAPTKLWIWKMTTNGFWSAARSLGVAL